MNREFIKHLLKQHNQIVSSKIKSNIDINYLTTSNIDLQTEDYASNLFFVKGNFKIEYLKSAKDLGVNFYISEEILTEINGMDYIIVKDIYTTMAIISQEFFGNPQNRLIKIGFTGTKGKTSSTYIMKEIFKANGNKVGYLATDFSCVDGESTFPSKLTTPEPIQLYQYMAEMVKNNVNILVMEVSSQAYKLGRLNNLTFDYGVFLNFSPDHISPTEHKDLTEYFLCKTQLILNSKNGIVDYKVFHEQGLSKYLREHSEKLNDTKITVFASNDYPKEYDNTYTVNYSNHIGDIFSIRKEFDKDKDFYGRLGVLGKFNQLNSVPCFIIADDLGIPYSTIAKGMANVKLNGRMEVFELENNNKIILDYAHNQTSIEHLLSEFPTYSKITVIGSTGNRAINRREGIGKALNKYSDHCILTSDEPSFENPLDIANEIAKYITEKDVIFIEDRESAIKNGLDKLSNSNNTILFILGKGIEKSQNIKGKYIPYIGDDTLIKDFILKE